MPKPAGVWLAQAMAFIVGVVAALASAMTLYVLAPILRSGHADVRFLAEAAIESGVVVCAAFALVGSQRRRAYGRWCGLALMACVVLRGGVTCVDGLRATSGDADHAGPAVDDVAMLAVVGATTALALSLAWAYGFSRRCRAWFGMPARAVST